MRKNFTIFLSMLFFISGLSAQTVPQEQQSLITKVTADWCYNCGTWGWSFYEDLMEDNDSKALMLKAHYSGGLSDQVGQDLSNNFGAVGQPRFYVDNTDQNVNSGSVAAKRTEIKNLVDNNATGSPIVNAAVDVYDDGTVNLKTEFFQNTSGDYYTSVYIVEEGVSATQTPINVVDHSDIIRQSLTTSTFGDLTSTGAVDAGDAFTESYEFFFLPDWNIAFLEFVAIVWKKEGDTYIYVNGSSTTVINPATPVNDLSEDIGISVYPTTIAETGRLELELDEQKEIRIDIIDLTGKKIDVIYDGMVSAGESSFIIEKKNAVPGMYFIRMTSGDKTATKKVIFR